MVVDPATGITEFVGAGLGVDTTDPGLAYDPFRNRLYMLNEAQPPFHDLYEIDVDSGIARLVGRMSTEVGNVGLAFNWSNRKFYATFGITSETVLYTVDVDTAQATVVGRTGQVGLAGLDYDPQEGTLIAAQTYNRSLYRIDPITAATTLIGTHGLSNVEGLAIQVAVPTLRVPAPGILANDTDADGDRLTATVASGPSNGTLSLKPDGGLTYAPRRGFIGIDTFTYKANDGRLDSNVATVTIKVVPSRNQAPVVDAGPDQTIGLADSAILAGSATDDGLPLPGVLTVAWSQVSGPGAVTFANPQSASTTAAFSAPGPYCPAPDGGRSRTHLIRRRRGPRTRWREPGSLRERWPRSNHHATGIGHFGRIRFGRWAPGGVSAQCDLVTNQWPGLGHVGRSDRSSHDRELLRRSRHLRAAPDSQ